MLPYVIKSRIGEVEVEHRFYSLRYGDYEVYHWDMMRMGYSIAELERALNFIVENPDVLDCCWWHTSRSVARRYLRMAISDEEFLNWLKRSARRRRRISESLRRMWGEINDIYYSMHSGLVAETEFGTVYAVHIYWYGKSAVILVTRGGEVLASIGSGRKMAKKIHALMKGDRRHLKTMAPIDEVLREVGPLELAELIERMERIGAGNILRIAAMIK